MSEVQRITIMGDALGGTFSLRFRSAVSASIDVAASDAGELWHASKGASFFESSYLRGEGGGNSCDCANLNSCRIFVCLFVLLLDSLFVVLLHSTR